MTEGASGGEAGEKEEEEYEAEGRKGGGRKRRRTRTRRRAARSRKRRRSRRARRRRRMWKRGRVKQRRRRARCTSCWGLPTRFCCAARLSSSGGVGATLAAPQSTCCNGTKAPHATRTRMGTRRSPMPDEAFAPRPSIGSRRFGTAPAGPHVCTFWDLQPCQHKQKHSQ